VSSEQELYSREQRAGIRSRAESTEAKEKGVVIRVQRVLVVAFRKQRAESREQRAEGRE
jgi:hypothetical protein